MKSHETEKDLAEPDCIVGFSFGTSTGNNSVNAELGALMLNLANRLPLIADRTLVNAIPNGKSKIAHIIDGDPTHCEGEGLNTWGTWIEAQKYMNSNNLSHPLVIAQAYHAPRVVKQGEKLGISSLTPDKLPTDFDKSSKQFWTRSAYLWLPVNALGSLMLRARDQL